MGLTGYDRRGKDDTMINDIKERLRDMVSGPHKRGRKYTVAVIASGETLLEAADRIEALEAEVERLEEKLMEAGPDPWSL